jgi:UPF0755 protein
MRWQASVRKRRLSFRHWSWLLVVAVIAVIVGVGLLVKHIYHNELGAVSSDQTAQVFTVDQGSTVKQIAGNLEKAHLIRSAWAMELYVHGRGVSKKLQAGTFAISPDEDVPTIVGILTKGRVSTQLVTIYPGERVDQVRARLINYGFKPDDVDQALTNIGQYSSLPIMAIKPAGVTTLEGLLWPDSWYKDATSTASDIIRQSLSEAGDHVTPDVQAAFNAEGLTPYQGITLASVVIQEVNKPGDMAQAAQVFMSRLKAGSLLQSDVTARYGSIAAGQAPSLTFDSPYNTHLHPGLPPAPISSINDAALQAAAHPAATSWLYFVTGDNGVTYFSTNLKDHEALTAKYCHKLCSQ